MLGRLFTRPETSNESAAKRISGKKVLRHSSGWSKTMMRLKAQEGLRVLDIGPTSPSNINYLTNLGHSVFMADLVEESVKPAWIIKSSDGSADTYDRDGFIEKHMNFGHRMFDVVLLWDALDYIPAAMTEGVVQRLHASMEAEGEILSFFHARAAGQSTTFCRYHLTDGENVEMQECAEHPLLNMYPNRAIEKLFTSFTSCRFFLAKDNLCEVVVKR